MASFARYKPFYVSMSIRNDGLQDPPNYTYDVLTTPDNTIYAKCASQYNQPLLEKASDFLVAVERMELTLNGIPFYDANEQPREVITIRSRRDAGSEIDSAALTDNAYSLTHLFDILNAFQLTDPYDLSTFKCNYSINKDGFILVSLLDNKTFNDVEIHFPRRLNMILGISTAQQYQVPLPYTAINQPYTECASLFPRTDMGDDLDHIVLQTNLPTNSDSAGNAKIPILTDFSSPSNYGNSLAYGTNGTLVKAGFSSNIRQRVIYTPTERRYLELIGDFPVQDLTIEALYVSANYEQLQVTKNIPLPIGGSFEIKLGFYLRQ